MRLLYDRFSIHPAVPFAIARSSTTAYDRIHVRLIDDDGIEGWGEAAPNKYYKESPETVVAALPKLERVVARSRSVGSLADIDVLEEWLRTDDPGNSSARAAISAAAHDVLGKREGRPLWSLLGLDPMMSPPSSFTIAIADQEHVLLRRIEEAHRYPILKIKLGTDRDLETIRAVRRAAPNKTLRADANAAWSVRRTLEMLPLLVDAGFELLEQPLPADDIEGLREVMRQSAIPIIADESCRTASDLPRLEGAVHGINIKLSKCGGLAEARRMALDASRRGLKVMLGCMIESSLGITAAAHLAPLVNFADLDGAALLKDDPFVGASIEDGMVRLPAAPGLGVTKR
jgi:L-Ala-D/L-Glu epimerase